MPNYVIDTPTTARITLAANDAYFLLEGVTHSFGIVPLDISGSFTESYILGSLIATQEVAINLGSSTNTSIFVGPTGVILSPIDFPAILSSGAFTLLNNQGTIAGSQVNLGGDNSTFVNGGTMNGLYLATDGVAAVQMGGENALVLNDGTITSKSEFVVKLDSWGRVTNSGTISGALNAISATSLGPGESIVVSNSGTITSNGFAIASGLGADVILNTGTIMGDAILDGGADTYRAFGTGVTVGTVSGGTENDTLIGGDLADSLDGGANDDLLVGHGGDDTLIGGTGSDLVQGNAGDDSLDGGEGFDTLNGGAGNDTVFGGNDNDTLVGQDGDDYLEDEGTGNDVLDGGAGIDTLIGGEGNDSIRGRDGADFLTGGLGLDILTGGTGADAFVYTSVTESPATAQRDVILDFEKGVDQINLFEVVPGPLTFRATLPFTSSGAAELRLQETQAGSTIVRVDVNGDGVQDMEINVAQVQGMTVDDFVL